MQKVEEIVLQGLPISKGIAIGLPFFLANREQMIPETDISQEEVENEIGRYRQALHKTSKDLKHLQKVMTQEGTPEVVAILDAHLEMLRDPLMTTEVEERVQKECKNIESVFRLVIEDYKEHFDNLEDAFFQERSKDIIDVSRRILGHLCPYKTLRLSNVPSNSIVLAEELVPSDTAEATTCSIAAFVTSVGGVTSHAAIIARAKGIPFVANVNIKNLNQENLKSLVVDGTKGQVILNPTQETLNKYKKLKQSQNELHKLFEDEAQLVPETVDGYSVRIFGNIETLDDIDLLIKQEASGIGLFRSEYLFLLKQKFPTEEEQFKVYKQTVEKLSNKPVIIRVFDIGGDKRSQFPNSQENTLISLYNEVNPVLGCRAIRFLLRNLEIFKQQLRALLKASLYGKIQILIPMVTDISEPRKIRKLVEEMREELWEQGIQVMPPPIGCMIEVPSAAIMCEALAQEADFLSIGTNDLIQYVLASDRTNPDVSDIYYPAHPSILRLIRMIVTAATRYQKPLILCGEVAADSYFIPLLLGLGIRAFSVAPRHIPEIKHTIRNLSIIDACRLVEKVFHFTSSDQIKDYLESFRKDFLSLEGS